MPVWVPWITINFANRKNSLILICKTRKQALHFNCYSKFDGPISSKIHSSGESDGSDCVVGVGVGVGVGVSSGEGWYWGGFAGRIGCLM